MILVDERGVKVTLPEGYGFHVCSQCVVARAVAEDLEAAAALKAAISECVADPVVRQQLHPDRRPGTQAHSVTFEAFVADLDADEPAEDSP